MNTIRTSDGTEIYYKDWGKGMIHAAEANVAGVTDQTIVIPGHGPAGNKAGLMEFRDMLAVVRDKVGGMKKQGMTLEQVAAARPTLTTTRSGAGT